MDVILDGQTIFMEQLSHRFFVVSDRRFRYFFVTGEATPQVVSEVNAAFSGTNQLHGFMVEYKKCDQTLPTLFKYPCDLAHVIFHVGREHMREHGREKYKVEASILKGKSEILGQCFPVAIVFAVINIAMEKVKIAESWCDAFLTPVDALFDDIKAPVFTLPG